MKGMVTNVAVCWVILFVHIRKFPGSNLGRWRDILTFNHTVQGKVASVQAMKAYRSRRIVPHILNCGTRRRWAINALTPRRNTSIHWRAGWVGPRAGLEQETSCLCSVPTPDPQARSLSLYQLRYFSSLCHTIQRLFTYFASFLE